MEVAIENWIFERDTVWLVVVAYFYRPMIVSGGERILFFLQSPFDGWKRSKQKQKQYEALIGWTLLGKWRDWKVGFLLDDVK